METSIEEGVQSPCVRNCCLNEADICLGCFRSLEEITRWSLADDETKKLILALAAERRSLCSKRIKD